MQQETSAEPFWLTKYAHNLPCPLPHYRHISLLPDLPQPPAIRHIHQHIPHVHRWLHVFLAERPGPAVVGVVGAEHQVAPAVKDFEQLTLDDLY